MFVHMIILFLVFMNTCDGNPFSKSLDTGIFWSRKPATGSSDKVTSNSVMRIPTWEQYMVQHMTWCYIRVIYILPLALSIFSGIIINLAEHWNLQSYIYKGKKGDLYSGCSLRTARRWFLSLKWVSELLWQLQMLGESVRRYLDKAIEIWNVQGQGH